MTPPLHKEMEVAGISQLGHGTQAAAQVERQVLDLAVGLSVY